MTTEVGSGIADLVAILRHALSPASSQAPMPRLAPGAVDRIAALAIAHRVACVIAREVPDEPIGEALAGARARATVQALRAVAALREASAEFAHDRIAFIAWKGPVLAAQAWGDGATRTFDDIDLVVRPADVARAVAALARAGWRSRHPGMSDAQRDVVFASQRAIELTRGDGAELLELHWAFGARRYGGFPRAEGVIDRAVPVDVLGATLPAPAPADALTLHAVHATKHGWSTLEDVLTYARLRAAAGAPGSAAADAQRHREGAASGAALGAASVAAPGAGTALALGDALATRLLGAPAVGAPSPRITRLVDQVIDRWTAGQTSWRPSLAWDLAWTDGVARRARLLARSTFDPTLQEWNAVRLPAPLGALYRVIRPARLAWRALGSRER